jgi:hypothetical protein
LIFKNNTITRSFDFEPWQLGRYTIELTACRNVEISGNVIGKDVLGKNILMQGMTDNELKNENTELNIQKQAMPKIELLKD